MFTRTFSAFLSEMSCFSSTVMLSLRFFTMSAGDLWDLPKGKGMAKSYHDQATRQRTVHLRGEVEKRILCWKIVN